MNFAGRSGAEIGVKLKLWLLVETEVGSILTIT